MELFTESAGIPHRRRGVKRIKRHNLRVDMTPMVDLGFLLIAFFIMTTELNKPVSLKLIMPKESGTPVKVENSNALTILLGAGNAVYYYHGNWEEAKAGNQVFKTDNSKATIP